MCARSRASLSRSILSDNSVEIPDNIGVGDVGQLERARAPAAAAAQGARHGLCRPGQRTAIASCSSIRRRRPDTTKVRRRSRLATSTFRWPAPIRFNLPTCRSPTIQPSSHASASTASTTTIRAPTYELVAEIPEAQTSRIPTRPRTASLGAALNDDSLDQANYNYFVTFYRCRASRAGRRTNRPPIAVSVDDRRIRLENLPQPDSARRSRTSASIATSTGQPGNFYLVDELPAGTTTYIDNTPDADIMQSGELARSQRSAGEHGTAAGERLHVRRHELRQPVSSRARCNSPAARAPAAGSTWRRRNLTITSTTTVLDLINFMQESLGIQTTSPDPDNPLAGNPGGSLTGDSQLQFESNDGIYNAVHVDQNAFRLTTAGGTPQTIPLTFSERIARTTRRRRLVVGNDRVRQPGHSADRALDDGFGIDHGRRDDVSLVRHVARQSAGDRRGNDGRHRARSRSAARANSSPRPIDTVSIDRRDVASNSPVTFDLDFSQVTALSQSTTRHSSLEPGRLRGRYAGELFDHRKRSHQGRVLERRDARPGPDR